MNQQFSLQQRIREMREAKRATMDARHEHILSTVADQIDMSLEDAGEFMLDDNQVKLTFQWSSLTPNTHL